MSRVSEAAVTSIVNSCTNLYVCVCVCVCVCFSMDLRLDLSRVFRLRAVWCLMRALLSCSS